MPGRPLGDEFLLAHVPVDLGERRHGVRGGILADLLLLLLLGGFQLLAALLVGEALRLFGCKAFGLFLLLDGLDALRHVALCGAGEHGVFTRNVGRRGKGGGSGRIVPGSLAGDGKAERGGFGSPGARRRDAEANASGNDQRGASHGHHARRDARSLLGVSFHCQASNTFRQATHNQTAEAVTAWLIVRGFAAEGRYVVVTRRHSTVNDPRRAKLCGGGFTFCSLDKRKIA